MMGFRRVFLSTLLAASLATGFAVAQDAPPPPDSQYPASSDAAQYPTQDSTTMSQGSYGQDQGGYSQQDQGGYPQTAPSAPQSAQSAPPPPEGTQLPDSDDQQDPSSRVARMQFMDGQVSIQPGGVNDWVAGTLNRPMTTGDNVWTDKNSKAELNVGTGVFRMGAETSVTLANVADKTTQIQVHQGTLNLRVRHLYDGEVYEIDTPNMAFTVQKPGDYRFDVDPNADTSYVTVRKGEGNATGDGPAVEVREHEKARFSNGTSMAYQVDKASGYDQFDEWAMSRDEHDDRSISSKYVSPDVIGSSDLDDYGTWKETQDYGNVWVPSNEGGDWAPYSDGNWIYQQPYGWTWVGYEPWGFAPYHYGRWVYGGWGWGWAPGPYAYWGSPYYAPALVGWYGGGGWGWGGGFGIGVGFGGGWGWCALGFGEPFYPWYHHGRGYFRNVNIRNTRITNINNITNNYYRNGRTNTNYRNASVRNGLVAANGRTITNGLPVRNNRMSLNNSQRSALLQHPATRNVGSQLRPTAESRIGAQARTRNAVTPPSRATSRQVVSHLSPPARGNGSPMVNARGNGSQAQGINNARQTPGMNNGRQTPGANNGRPSAGLNNGRANQPTSPMTQHNVPRPSNPSGAVNRGGNPGMTSRPGGNTAANGHYVPRPPSAGGNIGTRQMDTMPTAPRNMGSPNGQPSRSSSSNVPRPSSTYSRPGQSYSAPTAQAHNVPRPTGPVQQPSRGSYGNSPNYGRSYNSPSPNYGRSYSSPSPSSGRGYSVSPPSSYGRSYSSPAPAPRASSNYGGYGGPSRGYSAPSAPRYNAPSAPHYSAPSYGGGGGGHYSAPPAYHGGGGGYSGGGGHVSGGGGGGHASAGGGGHSGGGSHH